MKIMSIDRDGKILWEISFPSDSIHQRTSLVNFEELGDLINLRDISREMQIPYKGMRFRRINGLRGDYYMSIVEPVNKETSCINCGVGLEEVFEGSAASSQFKDALNIQIHLGYGEFRDHGPDQNGSPEGCLCKKCADILIEIFPGLKRLIDGE